MIKPRPQIIRDLIVPYFGPEVAPRLPALDPSKRIIQRLAKLHGGKASLIEEALRRMDGTNEISRETLLAEITRRLK